MKSARRIATLALLVAVVYVFQTSAQQTQRTARPSDQDEQPTGGTMRPVIRGTHAAVSSMKPEATRAAENILRAGGNAFDAAVAGQAVLALVDPASNGIGSDAEILIYNAKTRQPYSINAEAPAPKLATIEWYNKNNGGKIPTNDGLLSGSIPGTVDAWYILLDRWGTMSFEKVLEQAIDVAENGFPLPANLARSLASSKLAKYPTSMKVYQSKRYTEGELFKNSDLARTLRKLVEAEKQNASKGRHAALKAARDRFYKGDIAQTMARFSEGNGGLFRYEDFANYTAKVETPVSTDYRGYRVYKNKSNTQGPADYSLVPGEANALARGKRPRSTLATTLIMKDGQPYGLMGSPGADDQLMRTVQTLLNIVDFDMNVQQAIEAPRWSTRSFPASPFPHTMYPGDLGVESRIGEKVQQALIAKGHKLRVSGSWSMSEMAVIVIDPKTGVLHAGADPRNDAYAWAW